MTESTTCLHGNTVQFSRSLNLDKCRLCESILVWCDLTGAGHESVLHWHRVDTVSEAIALAKAIAMTQDKRSDNLLERIAKGVAGAVLAAVLLVPLGAFASETVTVTLEETDAGWTSSNGTETLPVGVIGTFLVYGGDLLTEPDLLQSVAIPDGAIGAVISPDGVEFQFAAEEPESEPETESESEPQSLEIPLVVYTAGLN